MPKVPSRHAGRPSWMEPITARLTPTIKAIVVVLATTFLFSVFVPPSRELLGRLAVGTHLFQEPWQAVTGLLVMFRPLNFLASMLGLWFVGAYIEGALGRRRFLTLFLGTGILANIALGTVAWVLASPAGDVGASLAVLGLFVAHGRLWGNQEVGVFPGVPLAFKAKHVSTFWVLFLVVASLISGDLPYLAGVLVATAAGYLLAGPVSFRHLYDTYRSRRLRQRYKVLDGGAAKPKKPRDKYWN